ncbi:MAG: type II toxin-antitoxin system RnlB family antitoxin [Ureaplasma sp.]|nr:type II toxin-antitoxin system RnlB family antitoxin [Ureaplasma sp.]
MKRYLEFVIMKLDDTKYYLVTLTYKGLTYYKKKIERYLTKQNFKGDIYLDQLSVTSDGYNRFAIIPFRNNELDFRGCKHLDLGIEYKQMTSTLFYNHPELIGKYTFIPSRIREKFAKNEPA